LSIKKLPTLLLALLLFSSTYADERMSKDDLLKQWEGNVITMNGLHKKPISFKVSNNELIYINNGDSSVTDAWIRDNGKLCIEYRYQDDCHRVIKTSEGIFTVKGLASTQSFRKGTSTTYKKNILTLSGEAREMLSEQTTFKNTIADENNITSTSSEKKPFSGKLIEYHYNGNKKLEEHWELTGSAWPKANQKTYEIKYYQNGSTQSEVEYDINGVKQFEIKYDPEGVIVLKEDHKFENFLNKYNPGSFSILVFCLFLLLIKGVSLSKIVNVSYLVKWTISLITFSLLIYWNFIWRFDVAASQFTPGLENYFYFIVIYLGLFANYLSALKPSKNKKTMSSLFNTPLLIFFISIVGCYF